MTRNTMKNTSAPRPLFPDFSHGSPSALECAVIVASFRPGRLIDRCLQALLAQEKIAAPEIIVVDSSTDGTAERVQKQFPMVKVIALAQQTPQSAARNIGVAHTQARFIAFTDQDCIAPSDWLARLLAWHQAGDYVAVGGAIGNGTPGSRVGTASYLIEFNEFLPAGAPRPVTMLPHCNICFRRDVFTTVGPFAETPPGAEDLIFNFLIARQGGSILFDPTIVVQHMNRTDFLTFLRHQQLLGFGSAIARRTVALPGQVLVRYPLLAYGLPFVRLFLTTRRLFIHHRPALRRYLRLLPILWPGYVRWTVGFLAGLRYPLPPNSFGPTSVVHLRSTPPETVALEPH
ncbi:MAG TPA: glycosyltransferase [Methylomirabilota bacterium]|nr:glycosyltransferase [Methylomirabilota bacterium]